MAFYDMSDAIGNSRAKKEKQGHLIRFYSIPADDEVSFKAFLTQYEDQYNSAWNDQETYGRMDPISTFQRTSRKISLGWDVPASSVDEAKNNLQNAEKLLSFLYPVYETFEVGGAASKNNNGAVDKVTFNGSVDPNIQEEVERAAREVLLAAQRNTSGGPKRSVGVMTASPLFKLKFANLIMEPKSNQSFFNGTAKDDGLVGKLSGLTYQPDIEQGFFGHTEFDKVKPGVLIPQTIKFSCEFTVLHTEPLGYNLQKQKRSKEFPYHSDSVEGS